MENRVKLIETTWLQIGLGDWGRPGPGRSCGRASWAPAVRAAAAVGRQILLASPQGNVPSKRKGGFYFSQSKRTDTVTVDLWSATYVYDV